MISVALGVADELEDVMLVSSIVELGIVDELEDVLLENDSSVELDAISIDEYIIELE